ncbi:conserved hypothetical protein [Talaromyces stipitatus ATCC 10500]|uniref:Uncharacterized protein n=1 Tax=Talaromyces stipitatus (strain ATCC 10500 / CBS 375.48 / QM 6759 / NRRL 1006) TaxID=441959 RepID=B8LU75_TALSN|nr:uncharacterized protein TSTA_060400 [Talaromyces stipitatus ATCC 10500]EED22547.1 conserved hypothetical protein [Talaromyces stipitatus ATCC 10500]
MYWYRVFSRSALLGVLCFAKRLLMEYLQAGPPRLPISNQGQSRDNTTSGRYAAIDINNVGRWNGFNLGNILNQYGPLLTGAMIQREPMPTSPPQPITSETSLRQRFTLYLDSRIRRGLRVGFQHLGMQNSLGNRTIVSFGEGNLAQTVENFIPDTAYFATDLPESTRPNRAPGDLKPSYKWSSDLRNGPTQRDRKEFKQALSQVNWYMKQHRARYGFILTDRELVAIRRLDNYGNLELSDSIPWIARGSVSQPQLTVLLALWYLGMLSSDNQWWSL